MTAPTKTVAGGGGYGARRTTDDNDNGVISNDAGTSSSSVPERDMVIARRNSLRSTPGAFHIDGPSMPAGDGAGDDDDNSAVAEVRAALAAEEAEGRAVRVGGIGTVPDDAMPEGSDNSSAARRENSVLDAAMTVVSEITTPPSVAQLHPMPNTRNNGEVSAAIGTSPPTNRRPSMETSGAVITQAYGGGRCHIICHGRRHRHGCRPTTFLADGRMWLDCPAGHRTGGGHTFEPKKVQCRYY